MQHQKLKVWLPLFISLSMVMGMVLGYRMKDSIPGKGFFYREHTRPIQEIMDLIEQFYVDSVSLEDLSDTAIEALLKRLDPHSVYIPASALQQMNEEIAGGFSGVGIEFNIFDDTVHVINVLKDGPGFRAGLQAGDMLLRAGDSLLSGNKLASDGVRKILKGQEGSEVTVTLLRKGRPLSVKIIRGMVPLTSVDTYYMMNETTGYIRLNKFSQQTYREFMEALDSLKSKGAGSLVLDLRDNGGGVLDEAVEIADEFLDGDKLITYTEGLHNKRKDYRCRRLGQFEKGRLAVLIDGNSASASEILSGALQDWDRADIIGRRSFGKGLVQEQFDLSDNSAIRLTIARYYTPLGRCIQRSYAGGEEAYYEEFAHRMNGGEYVSADSISNDTSKPYRTLGGKVLYGGGGITPDYFIPGDTGRMSDYSVRIMFSGLINSFGYRYAMKHPELARSYSSPEDFATRFRIGKEEWVEMLGRGAEDSLSTDYISSAELESIKDAMKRAVGRQIWKNEGFYRMLNAADPAIRKALEVLGNKKPS